MKICFFGIYDPEYSRNKVLISGFRENGVQVVECRVDPKQYKGFSKYRELWKAARKLRHEKFDHVIVGFPGHTVLWLAYLLFGRRIIFDFFISLYNSEIEDKRKSGKSFRALQYYFLDWYSCKLASRLLLDTNAHSLYISEKFSVPQKKCIRVFVGSPIKPYSLREKDKKNVFIVHFHGNFSPLQGIEYIIHAADLLKNHTDIIFHIYGGEQKKLKRDIRELVKKLNLTNVVLGERFPMEKLAEILSVSDVVLGIFGATVKAENVIPNKVYEGLATKKPVITAQTKAVLELLTDREDVVLCRSADPEDLAEKILLLKQDGELRDQIAQKGFELFRKKLVPKKIVENLLSNL